MHIVIIASAEKVYIQNYNEHLTQVHIVHGYCHGVPIYQQAWGSGATPSSPLIMTPERGIFPLTSIPHACDWNHY